MGRRRSESDPWAGATWEGAAEASLAAGAKLTLPERLLWLEQTSRLARQVALRRPGDEPSNARRSPADPSQTPVPRE